MAKELDIYTNGDNEQQTTCPKCGSRTYFIDVADSRQQHECMSCGYKFILEFDNNEDL